MPSRDAYYKDKDPGRVVLSFSAKWVSWLHTALACSAFLGALLVGSSLHYHKIVRNEWFGYPQEWFPSVSATIGDRYPERSLFMLLIAATSGPRFALVGLWYLLLRGRGRGAGGGSGSGSGSGSSNALPKVLAAVGVFRTLTCGGWTYITSTDDHGWHDILMISYLVATLPWTLGCIALSPASAGSRPARWRRTLAAAFFGTLVPMVYFYIQHKVHRVPGAYTTYSFFEWSLVLLDIAFDAVTVLDFDAFEVVVSHVRGSGSSGPDETQGSPAVITCEKKDGTAMSETDKTAPATGGAVAAGLTWTEALDTAADVYHGFIFWSILTSLGVVVWYFPLWHMGISGFEAFIMSTTMPALLAFPALSRLITRNLRAVHLVSLAGIAAFLVRNPVLRLVTVGLGVGATCLGWAASLRADAQAADPGRLESRAFAWGIGLMLSSVAKYACHSNNPVWPILNGSNGGWNRTGLVLAVLAAMRFTRKPKTSVRVHDGGSAAAAAVEASTASPASTASKGSPVLAACGLGGLLFGLHSLLSDTSTMILWAWEGYPVRGPVAATHGWITLAAMTCGLFAGSRRPGLATSWPAFAVGCASVYILTFYHNWLGYSGALGTAAYLMAVAVPLLANAGRGSPAATFGLGFLIYNFVVLFHVWVVAYAFVPGGPLVRERTDWVNLTMMALVGCGLVDLSSGQRQTARLEHHHRHSNKTNNNDNNDDYDNNNDNNDDGNNNNNNNNNNKIGSKISSKINQVRHTGSPRYLLGAAAALVHVLFFCAAAFRRGAATDPRPYRPDDHVLTAAIWTIHFSLDNDMWSSERRIGQLLRELEVDVVGLLESDLQRIIMGNRDTTQFLAEDLGMYVDYGPGPNKHTWGAALLSRFPIVNSTHHLLPSPAGELAPAIHATVDAYGVLVDVFVFHSGQEEDPEDRRLQAEYLAALMGSTAPRPAVLLSYLVTRPLRGNYNTYVSDTSGMHDVDPSDWDRWCEYILFRGLRRVGYARVSRGTITDTELQVAKFVVPLEEPGSEGMAAASQYHEDPVLRGRSASESDVPVGWRFPAMFRGDGVRGHRYHVFDGPRYFM